MAERVATVHKKSRVETRGKSAAPSQSGWVLSQRSWTLLICTCLAIAVIAVYYPVSSHPFINYDDDVYILHNSHIKAGLSLATTSWAFTSFYASNWHPLTWLSHAADYEFFGLDAGKQHDVNLLLHVINVLLLFWVLWRATGYIGRSAMVAALFAIHPINVETVAWIAERKNLLSMMFFLLALGAYTWYARSPRLARYLTVAVLFALGLMSKPQVITLPFVLLLWDYWPLQRLSQPRQTTSSTVGVEQLPSRPLSGLVVEKLPLLALSAASAVVTVLAQYESGSMSGPHWQPFSARLENAAVAYARYLGKAFWPVNLMAIYPHPGNSLRMWQVSAALVLLLATTALVIAARRQQRYLLVGWLWFLGTLVPMIGVLQVGVQAMADRYAYLPFIGLFIMICWGVADWAKQRQLSPAWQIAVGVVILLPLALASRHQLTYWSDDAVFWSRIVEVESQALKNNPNNWVAEDVLGHALLNIGAEEAAIPHFRAAAALNPSDPDSNVNVGAAEQRHNNLTAAIAQYQKVIALTESAPRQNSQSRAQAFSNMGFAYRKLKDYSKARESFEQAVAINPDDSRSWLAIGIMAYKSGDSNAAISAYTKALKINPFDWGYLLLARALDATGQSAQAEVARLKAAAISQNMQEARKMADSVLAE
jgi:tetratricopeptide (TPR) repeat protein